MCPALFAFGAGKCGHVVSDLEGCLTSHSRLEGQLCNLRCVQSWAISGEVRFERRGRERRREKQGGFREGQCQGVGPPLSAEAVPGMPSARLWVETFTVPTAGQETGGADSLACSGISETPFPRRLGHSGIRATLTDEPHRPSGLAQLLASGDFFSERVGSELRASCSEKA